MEKNQTEEGNRIIALFMGLRYDEHDEAWTDGKYAKHDILKYSSSWGWIMPVAEKIEQSTASTFYGFSFQIRRKYVCILAHEKNKQDSCVFQTPYNYCPETKIQAVYEAVVQFIQWYNTQTSQTK